MIYCTIIWFWLWCMSIFHFVMEIYIFVILLFWLFLSFCHATSLRPSFRKISHCQESHLRRIRSTNFGFVRAAKSLHKAFFGSRSFDLFCLAGEAGDELEKCWSSNPAYQYARLIFFEMSGVAVAPRYGNFHIVLKPSFLHFQQLKLGDDRSASIK